MEDLLNKGIEKGFISFNEDKSRITYTYVSKTRNYLDPEEQVEAQKGSRGKPIAWIVHTEKPRGGLTKTNSRPLAV